MADGQPEEASRPDRRSRPTRVRRAVSRVRTGTIGRSRRLGARLVTVAGRVGARSVAALRGAWTRLVSALRRLRVWSLARARRHRPRLAAVSRRVWRWVLSVARRVDAAAKEGPAPPPPEEPIERREPAGPITVFARGHVFTFAVHAAFTWCAQGLRPDQLAWYAHYFTPRATQRLTQIATGLARTVPPHRADDLEERLQHVLSHQEPWPFERGGHTVTCRVEAWIRLDERVRRTLQPYWERMIALDCRHEEMLRRARYAEQLNQRWSEVLADLADGDVPEALREELGRLREQTVAEQRVAAQWTGELLRQRRHKPDLFEPSTDPDATRPPSRPTEPGPAPAADQHGRPAEQRARPPEAQPDPASG